MTITLNIDDAKDILPFSDDYVTEDDLKKALFNMALNELVDKIYYEYITDQVIYGLDSMAKNYVKEKSDEIIEMVADRVSEKIEKKKEIISMTPKKSEINNINKEWETYFVELIDKAIAKRFR